MKNIFRTMIATSLVLALAACGNVSHRVANDGSTAGELVWPSPDSTTPMHKGGTFPNLANLRLVRAGLNKQQVSDLIGYPHFSEGVWGVREWNYLFNFRQPDTGEVTVCQFKVLFDEGKLARSFYWKPASCAAVLETKPPAVAASPVPAMQKRVLSADALFAFDKGGIDDISPAGHKQLDELASELRGSGARVQIAGYTDRLGTPAYNLRLSQHRAEAVKQYLATQGVADSRMSTDGRGAADPVKGCSEISRPALIACLAPNRRVEVKIDGGE